MVTYARRLSGWCLTILILMTLSTLAAAVPALALGPQGLPPQLSVSPNRLVMDEFVGTVGVLFRDASLSSSDGSALAYTASVQAGGDWLTVASVSSGLILSKGSSVSATAPGTIRAIADDTGLPAGIYQGIIAIAAPSALDGPQLIYVTLTVRSRPVILLHPDALSFSHLASYNNNHP